VYEPVCVSWDFDGVVDPGTNVTRGNWTDNGCMLTSTDNDSGVFVCSCNHLTNFAVLVVSCIQLSYY